MTSSPDRDYDVITLTIYGQYHSLGTHFDFSSTSGTMNSDTPRTKINEEYWEYIYTPVYLDEAHRELIGWQLRCNQHWVPLRDPPRLIDHYHLAYFDHTITSLCMKLKWRNQSPQDAAKKMFAHLTSADFH